MANISRRELLSGGLSFLIGLAMGYALKEIYSSTGRGVYRGSSQRVKIKEENSYKTSSWAEGRLIDELQQEHPSEKFLRKFNPYGLDVNVDNLRELVYRTIKESEAPLYLAKVPELRELSLGDIALMLAKDNRKEIAANKERLVYTDNIQSGYSYDGTDKGLEEIRRMKDDIIIVAYGDLEFENSEPIGGKCGFAAISFFDPDVLPDTFLEASDFDENIPWIYSAIYTCGNYQVNLMDINRNGKVDEAMILY